MGSNESLGRVQGQLFALCHARHNLAEYERYMEAEELVGACGELQDKATVGKRYCPFVSMKRT